MIRGQRAIIDSDLANLYGVKTKRLKEQVKRNSERFPADFVLQLTKAETDEVVAKCDHLKNSNFQVPFPWLLQNTEQSWLQQFSTAKLQ